MRLKLFWGIGIILFIFSCSNEREKIAITDLNKEIIRLDDSLFHAQNMMDIQKTLTNHYPMANAYFLIDSNNLHIFSDAFYSMTLNENLKEFYLQSQQPEFFGNKEWENDLLNALGRIKTLYPENEIPKIYTLFTGFGGGGNFSSPALLINDSSLVIGLDYYMGEKGKFLPQELYSYQLRKYSPKAMVSQVILEYAGLFNKHKKSNVNLLGDMIWAGKNYFFVKETLPNIADSTLFGYTSKEIQESEKFESIIWEHFIKNSLLYKEDELTKTKYMGDRPKTLEIGPECPGSIGRWLGYRIIQSYMKNHPERKIQDLMIETDINKLFRESGYRPNQ